jgi:hypothetical protein
MPGTAVIFVEKSVSRAGTDDSGSPASSAAPIIAFGMIDVILSRRIVEYIAARITCQTLPWPWSSHSVRDADLELTSDGCSAVSDGTKDSNCCTNIFIGTEEWNEGPCRRLDESYAERRKGQKHGSLHIITWLDRYHRSRHGRQKGTRQAQEELMLADPVEDKSSRDKPY